MNSKEAFAYLHELEGKGIKLGLERIKKGFELLLKEMPFDLEKILFVKVAGTNGKGSTATMIANILQAQGHKTGLYISPHIVDFKERIQVNAQKIKEKELIEGIDFIKKFNEKNSLQLSHFEFITLLAFRHFFRKKCNAIVLETGMGGRLDATNVVKAKIDVITNIALEHEKMLGNSIEKIAFEKAGIIDENAIVITGEKKQDALKVFREKCREKNASLLQLNKEFFYKIKKMELQKSVFDFKNEKNELKDLEIAFAGEHFAENAVLAVETALQLGVGEREIRSGLKKAKIVGRFQVIGKKPLVIVDCAHNPDGIRRLVETVQKIVGKKIVLVFGCSDDKRFERMVKELSKIAEKVYCTQAEYRGLDAEILKKEFEKNGFEEKEIIVEMDSRKALKKALEEMKKNDVILVCGSCFLVGEILR